MRSQFRHKSTHRPITTASASIAFNDIDNTVTQTDNSPKRVNAVLMAANIMKLQNIVNFLFLRAKKSPRSKGLVRWFSGYFLVVNDGLLY